LKIESKPLNAKLVLLTIRGSLKFYVSNKISIKFILEFNLYKLTKKRLAEEVLLGEE